LLEPRSVSYPEIERRTHGQGASAGYHGRSYEPAEKFEHLRQPLRSPLPIPKGLKEPLVNKQVARS
jgi:hypothetical protein